MSDGPNGVQQPPAAPPPSENVLLEITQNADGAINLKSKMRAVELLALLATVTEDVRYAANKERAAMEQQRVQLIGNMPSVLKGRG